ncbi:hypothetical protein QQS21_010898 [Conoideocrella luteorostrata]|uniref:Uncharacterized protein n=1 Tax=Conoideocrella luteorostrata TaxID=1105319 RepID=A0AAJ0CE52_9HYPO|nr:hypothetical protein QQS21_010898 [Conoideocrella luteorostrata]
MKKPEIDEDEQKVMTYAQLVCYKRHSPAVFDVIEQRHVDHVLWTYHVERRFGDDRLQLG